MHSVRTRILALALGCVLISNIIIILVGIIGVSNTVNDDSDLVIQQITKNKAREVDEQLLLAEQSVSTLYDYIMQDVEEHPFMWQNEEQVKEHLDDVHTIAELTLKNTSGTLSVYYHLTPDTGGGTSNGIYIVKSGDEEYTDYPASDVSAYLSGDDSSGSWYTEPLRKGEPVWLLPYKNEATDKDVISYVAPIIRGGTEIGVVGMDVALSEVRSLLTTVVGYDGSYAILMDSNGDFVYHPSYQQGISGEEFAAANGTISDKLAASRTNGKITGYRWNGEQRKILFRKVENGMYVGISVPLTEVRKPARLFALIALIITAAVLVAAYILTDKISAYIVKPLQELTEVSQKLAAGDLDVNIRCETGHDELEILADSIQKTADELKKQVESINDFARTDALTTVRNKAAYEEQIKQLKDDIEMDRAKFSVVVLDVNSLKHMNDTYGHEAGDLWITGAATAMERAFGRSRVYRIGGDEFAVILEPKGRKHFERMQTEFYKEIDRFNARDDKIYKEKLQVACGIADYDKEVDKNYEDVFRRADDEMYQNKKYLKGLAAQQQQ